MPVLALLKGRNCVKNTWDGNSKDVSLHIPIEWLRNAEVINRNFRTRNNVKTIETRNDDQIYIRKTMLSCNLVTKMYSKVKLVQEKRSKNAKQMITKQILHSIRKYSYAREVNVNMNTMNISLVILKKIITV